MKAYSKDLRLRVLDAVDRGMPKKEVVRVFGVSEPTIRRYLRLRRETGDVEPRPVPGPPARKREALEERLPAQVRLNPDLTLAEHCELFEEQSGMVVSASTMSRAFERLGLPLKKVAPGLRARRTGEGSLARRGSEDRLRAPRLRGRVRYAHVYDTPLREGSERRAGLRKGAPKPRQEHDALGEHDVRRHGAMPSGGGRHDEGGLRDLRGAGLGTLTATRTGSDPRQPLLSQGRAGTPADRGTGLLAIVLAALLAGLLTHRGGLLEDQSAAEEECCPHPRNSPRGHRAGDLGGHARRRGGLLWPLRLPVRRSTFMKTAVEFGLGGNRILRSS